MGASCSHSRLEPTGPTDGLREYSDTVLFKFIVSEVECKDCGQKFRAIKSIGKLTGFEYTGWKIQDPNDCIHNLFIVDESTKKVCKEQNMEGTVLRLLWGPSMDGIQYSHFWGADANCVKCNKVLKVRCDYKKEWRDKQIVELEASEKK